MRQIGFIGAYDKKDLLIEIGTVLKYFGKKVLIIDATSMQRLRYIVPIISEKPIMTFVSEYNNIDVALGFLNFNSISQYLGKSLNYDYILIDTDNVQTMNYFSVVDSYKVFFATSYDKYDENRGIELLGYIQKPTQITKLIISADITENQEKFLDNLLKNQNVEWAQEKVEFVDEIQNRRVTLENQLSNEVKLKLYTQTYKASLEYLTSLISDGEIRQDDIRKVIKKI